MHMEGMIMKISQAEAEGEMAEVTNTTRGLIMEIIGEVLIKIKILDREEEAEITGEISITGGNQEMSKI